MKQYTEEQIHAAFAEWYSRAEQDDPEDTTSWRDFTAAENADYLISLMQEFKH